MTDGDPLIGRTLGGRYRVDALVGRGGFGAVYRASHLELGRPVAIKTLLAEVAEGDAMRARFRREARVQAELRHPAVARLLDFGRGEDGLFYMVQEYVDGETLQSVLDAAGPLPPSRAVRIVRGVLGGLAAAHLRAIVHRDLKPANIMLVQGPRGEEVRILDFGLARLLGDAEASHLVTVPGQVLGTPPFMAPEQITDDVLTPATDQYAMGVVLYTLLTGQPPFRGKLHSVLTAHLMQPPPPLPEALPRALDAVVQRAMAKAPADRYPDVEAMDAALAAVEVEPAVALAPTRPLPTPASEVTPSSVLRGALPDGPGADEGISGEAAGGRWRGRWAGPLLLALAGAGVALAFLGASGWWDPPPGVDAGIAPMPPDAAVGPAPVDARDAARPDAAIPDAAIPDAAPPDAAIPDAAPPDAARAAPPAPTRRRPPPPPKADVVRLRALEVSFEQALERCDCATADRLLRRAAALASASALESWRSERRKWCVVLPRCRQGGAAPKPSPDPSTPSTGGAP